ncbi:hypothetical protein [Brevibacillus centrosporus]|uniref:hypothetical protein n=1 Tax=Brevibacillus centrosporus TaxID=54910 RepID=UPI002E21C55A|nr:hypothetical protein [Brevibacillus centrosporus]
MSQNQQIDHYHRFISILDDEDECLFVIPTSILKQANMEIGDEFIALARRNELVIKKLKQNATAKRP